MEIFYTILFGFIVRAVFSAIRKSRAQAMTIIPARESICSNCVHAHIARGYRASEALTYCTYAGVSREVKFAVSDCSMFCHRDAKPELVRVIGFAETHADQSVGPTIAA